MKVGLFEEFCRIEKLTPTITFLNFGSGNNRTLMYWKIEMYMEGQFITSVERGVGLEMTMLAVMIECLEMKFEGLGYTDLESAARLQAFIESAVAA